MSSLLRVDVLVAAAAIRPPAAAASADVRNYIERLAKPSGSLGMLERIALRLALIYGDPPLESADVSGRLLS